MPLNAPAFIANGTIRPSRFVKIDATKDHAVLEAAAQTDRIIGIAQPGTQDAPGVVGSGTEAAAAGEQLLVYGEADVCLLEAGAAIVRGDVLKSDAQGRGTPVLFSETANIFFGARALESAAAAGEKIRVVVSLGTARPA